MSTCNTLNALSIRKPLPISGLGTVFWCKSFYTAQRPPDGFPNFQAFLNQSWTTHYSVPSYEGCAVEIRLAQPLRTDEGFENVDIYVDYLMRTIERSYTRDWNQRVKIEDLSIPKSLITRLEKLLLQWSGERLMIHYCLLPGEGDPLAIVVEFWGCKSLPTDNPDNVLRYMAECMTEAFAA